MIEPLKACAPQVQAWVRTMPTCMLTLQLQFLGAPVAWFHMHILLHHGKCVLLIVCSCFLVFSFHVASRRYVVRHLPVSRPHLRPSLEEDCCGAGGGVRSLKGALSTGKSRCCIFCFDDGSLDLGWCFSCWLWMIVLALCQVKI